MVKCADCGFLAQRHVETRELRDAEEGYRIKGEIPRFYMHSQVTSYLPGPQYETFPICTERQIDFRSLRPDTVFQTIRDERECPAFTEWIPGFLPKEHREMLDRQWKLEQEEKVRKAVWDREDKRDQDAEGWHIAQMNALRTQHKTELIIFGAIVTILVVASTIIGSMIQAGWIAKPW